MKNNKILILLLFSSVFLFAQNEDTPGSKDYELLGRMPNYNIRNYWEYEFDAHLFYTSDDQKQSIEGRKIVIRYEHKDANDRNVKKPSYLQILRNYSSAISKAGGEILHEHKNANFGNYFFKTPAGKEVWVEVKSAPNLGRRYLLTVIEREPMKQDIVIKSDLIKENGNR